MEKQKKADKRLAKAIASGKPLEIKIKDELLSIEGPDELLAIEAPDELLAIEGPRGRPALMPPSTAPLASVDAETMQKQCKNTDKHNREQVIFDILQANMSNLGEDLYLLDHDQQTKKR